MTDYSNLEYGNGVQPITKVGELFAAQERAILRFSHMFGTTERVKERFSESERLVEYLCNNSEKDSLPEKLTEDSYLTFPFNSEDKLIDLIQKFYEQNRKGSFFEVPTKEQIKGISTIKYHVSVVNGKIKLRDVHNLAGVFRNYL